jgi:SAM-dependent methyltransferase
VGLKGSIGTRRRRWSVGLRRTSRAREELLRSDDLDEVDRALLRHVDLRVDPHDAMHVGDGEHYLRVGLSAARCIRAAAVATPRRILDLPCGHGRVLRMLRAAYPDADLFACDIDRHGADFCAAQFDAEPIYSSPDLEGVHLPEDIDLVWCGSLVTHLDQSATTSLLERLARTLAPGGTLVFTAHGDWVAERLEAREADYQLEDASIDRVLTEYRATGYGYADYPWESGYGVSLTSVDWVQRNAPLPIAFQALRGWDAHQDTYALRRPSEQR